jgi:hypothetical protein
MLRRHLAKQKASGHALAAAAGVISLVRFDVGRSERLGHLLAKLTTKFVKSARQPIAGRHLGPRELGSSPQESNVARNGAVLIVGPGKQEGRQLRRPRGEESPKRRPSFAGSVHPTTTVT